MIKSLKEQQAVLFSIRETCRFQCERSIKMSKQNNSASKKVFTVYLAGDLWNHKDLVGNAILADYINKVSRGRYQCVLPQDLEEPVHRTVDIRNVDLKHDRPVIDGCHLAGVCDQRLFRAGFIELLDEISLVYRSFNVLAMGPVFLTF